MPKPAKASRPHVVKSDLDRVYKHAGIDTEKTDEWVADYVHDATRGFLEEWAKYDDTKEILDDKFGGDAPDEVVFAVQDAINDNVSREVYEHNNNELLSAIESAMKDAVRFAAGQLPRAEGAFGLVEIEKYQLVIEIYKPFLEIWREETEGMGMAAWGGDEKLKDVDSAIMVLNIVDHLMEVYGARSISSRIESSMSGERWEPDTGSHGKLSKIADKALAKAVSNK